MIEVVPISAIRYAFGALVAVCCHTFWFCCDVNVNVNVNAFTKNDETIITNRNTLILTDCNE